MWVIFDDTGKIGQIVKLINRILNIIFENISIQCVKPSLNSLEIIVSYYESSILGRGTKKSKVY